LEQQINIEDNSEKRTYTVPEIARMLSISERTAYNLCKTTTAFKVISLGRNVRIHKQSFDEWFSQ